MKHNTSWWNLSFVVPILNFFTVGGSDSLCGSYPTELYATKHWKYLDSPNYLGKYPRDLECSWVIRASSSSDVVVVDTIDSNIEYSKHCSDDYVDVCDGKSRSAKSLGRFCGTETPTYQSTGRYVYIIFITDSVVSGSGFRLKYYSTAGKSRSLSGSVLGGLIGGLACFVIVTGLVCAYCQTARKRRTPPRHTGPHATTTLNQPATTAPPLNLPSAPAYEIPLPSYGELPPSYELAVGLHPSPGHTVDPSSGQSLNPNPNQSLNPPPGQTFVLQTFQSYTNQAYMADTTLFPSQQDITPTVQTARCSPD